MNPHRCVIRVRGGTNVIVSPGDDGSVRLWVGDGPNLSVEAACTLTQANRIGDALKTVASLLEPKAEALRDPVVHELKSWPSAFPFLLDGSKMFELRVNDRDFHVGDTLHIREWDPDTKRYSGREVRRLVTYICQDRWGLPAGLCIMSLKEAP